MSDPGDETPDSVYQAPDGEESSIIEEPSKLGFYRTFAGVVPLAEGQLLRHMVVYDWTGSYTEHLEIVAPDSPSMRRIADDKNTLLGVHSVDYHHHAPYKVKWLGHGVDPTNPRKLDCTHEAGQKRMREMMEKMREQLSDEQIEHMLDAGLVPKTPDEPTKH